MQLYFSAPCDLSSYQCHSSVNLMKNFTKTVALGHISLIVIWNNFPFYNINVLPQSQFRSILTIESILDNRTSQLNTRFFIIAC